MSLSFLEELTEAQRRAVTFGEGPLLVLAGPGSGKTRVITYRIAFLLHEGVSPEHVLALTFTNKAAREIAERVAALTGQVHVWVGTFHSFCAKLLRRHARWVGLEPNFTIYDEDQSHRILREVITRRAGSKHSLPVSSIAQAIHWAKNHLVLPEYLSPREAAIPADLLQSIYADYQHELLRNNAVDFDDLLFHTARLLGEHPELRAELDDRFRFILVDEYQDTNLAQYAVVRSISIDYPNLTVTGDPDQSIYRWRGASLRNILEFERDYPHVEVVRLEENYRSTQRILRVADSLIVHNTKRRPKRLFTRNPAGKPVRLVIFDSEQEEAAGIAAEIAEAVRAGRRQFRDFAILCRVNTMTRPLETALRQHRVPFQLVNAVEFYRRKEVQDILAYLRLVVNPRDDDAFLRVVHSPPRGIGDRTTQRLKELARMSGMSLAELVLSGHWVTAFSGKAARGLAALAELLRAISTACFTTVEALIADVISRSGYTTWLAQTFSVDYSERLANVDELLSAAREFDRAQPGGDLALFLEQVSLVGETDRWEDRANCVAVMTLHAAKGLEFPVVYIVGLEQGILPYEDSWRDPEELEEERRLLFVGMTRAQEELILTRAVYREHRGQRRLTIPSHFLLELRRDELEIEDRTNGEAGSLLSLPQPAKSGVDISSREPSQQEEALPVRGGPTARVFLASELVGKGGDWGSGSNLQEGSVVLHPQYGIGRVLALRGDRGSSLATVEFPQPVGVIDVSAPEAQLRVIRPGPRGQSPD